VTSGVAQTEAQSQRMAKAATDFDNTNQAIQSMMTKLMGELSELQSSWKGLGAGQFEKVKEQYFADLKALNKALADTAEAIRTSGASYDTTDTDAADAVAKTGNSGYTLPL
jgi:WXG100 family type VII secretion target